MPYRPLSVPPKTPPDLERIVRERVDPFLRDVHSMLMLPRGDAPGLEGGCTFPAAMTLFNLIGGVSRELYVHPDQGNKGSSYGGDKGRFERMLEDHFPWAQEPKIESAVVGKEAAEHLYRGYRNGLAHNLGHIYRREYEGFGALRIGKQPMGDVEIERVERATRRPPEWTIPTLRLIRYGDGSKGRKLKLKCFYWGVRVMIEEVLRARASVAASGKAQDFTSITASAAQSDVRLFTEVSSGSPIEYD